MRFLLDFISKFPGNYGSVQQELHDHLCCIQEYFPHLGSRRVPESGAEICMI